MSWTLESGMVVRRAGSGRPLVWIHGLGEQSASFDPITRLLPGFTHVLVDLPGYGRSPWPRRAAEPQCGEANASGSQDAPSSLAQVAEDLARWMPPGAIVAGHSMGGVLAQLVAEQTAIAAIVDIDGNLSRGDCTFSAQACAYSAADFAEHGFDRMRDEVYKRGISDPALRGYYVAMRMASPEVFHRHAVELVELSSTEALAARLAALAIPTLFVAGVPGGVCERSRALLDEHGVRWIGIADAGHWPFIDQPAAFAEAVARFTAAVP